MAGTVAIVMIRHGETAWNEAGRIQGYSDIPLSEAGRAEVVRWRLPSEFAGFHWVASPLARARDTALLLGADGARLRTDGRLREMHWGAWEGKTMADLAPHMDVIRAARAAGGLDFRPPGGESSRDVQDRVKPWLAEIAAGGAPVVAVAHKGVVRAIYSLATGWDMRAPEPVAIDWSAAHLFHAGADGSVTLARLNIALAPREPR